METPRRKIKRALLPSQPTEWRESPQRRRSPVKPTRYEQGQLNAITIDSASDSDLDRDILEILSPTRPSTNVAYVLLLFCLSSLPDEPLEHDIVQPSTTERGAHTQIPTLSQQTYAESRDANTIVSLPSHRPL